MKRLRLVLLLGVVLPTVLLAWGWYAAADKERRAVERGRHIDAVRIAEAVRAAVDESLEELRVRESRRPYYLYNFYYSPPDALALEDPVLVSPLSRPPEDPRLLGYFSIEPGGRARTPHTSDEQASELASRVLAQVKSDDLAPLRERVGGFEDNAVTRANEFVNVQAVDLKNAAVDPLLNARLLEQGRQNPVSMERVDEEPMAWHTMGPRFLLARFVRDQGGVATLQGVVLDREHLLNSWLPHLVRRHVHTRVTLVDPHQDTACRVREPVSARLPLGDLCFAELPGRPARGGPWQLALLLGLVGIATAGAFVVHRGSQRIEELSAQKSRFVSEVTHELRTPLTTMRMHAEMLRDGLVSQTRQPKVHRELAEESLRLGRLIENVLELSRLEGGRALDRRAGDLASCVADAAEAQRERLEAAGLSLSLHVPETFDAHFDAMAVRRVVVNLLDNAAKYAAGAEPPVVTVSLSDGAIIVRDHGPGVAPEERERVFERFHRGDDAAERAGTGIGLALVRDIAHAHGGSAEILPGDEGCAVRVTLGME